MACAASIRFLALEVQLKRLRVAHQLKPFVSKDWILKHVFKLSDEDISRLNPLDDFARQVFEGA
jgi:hypothetical protein